MDLKGFILQGNPPESCYGCHFSRKQMGGIWPRKSAGFGQPGSFTLNRNIFRSESLAEKDNDQSFSFIFS